MARKRLKVSRRMLITWFTFGGLILFFLPQDMTNRFQFAFAHVFRWPLSIGRSISLSAHRQEPITEMVSRREYHQLQNHLANVEKRLIQANQTIEELVGLQKKFSFLGSVSFVPSGIITSTIESSRSELMINRGENNSLSKGQFVLADNGVIGTVSEVWSCTAKVKLVTDPASNIAIKISDIGRFMRGAGNNTAKISLLSTKVTVKTGDYVYADKKPGFLDAPMVVGKVARCKRDDGNPSIWDITVEPVCDIESLKNVHVIVTSR